MRESELYPPVRDWLKAKGYVVHVEVFETDVLAVRDDKLTAIELKVSGTGYLEIQLSARAQWADFVYGVMPHRPKSIKGFQYHGFGLLVVTDGKVREVVKARPQPDHWHRRRAYRMKKLQARSPAQDHELAGLPACAALRAQRERRQENAGQ